MTDVTLTLARYVQEDARTAYAVARMMRDGGDTANAIALQNEAAMRAAQARWALGIVE